MSSAHGRIDAPHQDNHLTDDADRRVPAASARQHMDLDADTLDLRLQRLDLAPQPAHAMVLRELHHQPRHFCCTPLHEPELGGRNVSLLLVRQRAD